MNYGLLPFEIEKIISIIAKHGEIEQVILYGSRAKGNFRIDSDIDLTVKGKNISTSLLLQIENELDDLLLPYKIDLSVFHKIESKELLEHIDRVGIVIW